MANSSDAYRRWLAVLFLSISFAMLMWGETALSSSLEGLSYFVFWTIFFACTSATISIGLMDTWIMKRRTEDARRDLLRRLREGMDPHSMPDSREEK